VITAQKISSQKPIALVTNGGGFLGSFLCEALLSSGCRVICLDILDTKKEKNLERCFQNKDFNFVSYQPGGLLPAEIKNQEIFYIFDLTEGKNLNFQFWKLAEEKRAKILVVVPEKYWGENFSFQKFSKVDFRIIRLANIYGPRMEFENPQALQEKIFSSPNLFVSDAVFGILKAMFSGGTKGKVFYLGPRGEEEIKWRPRTGPEEGLRKTLAFFESNYFSVKTKKQKKSSKKFTKIALPFLFSFLIFSFLFFLPFGEIFLGGQKLKKAGELFLNANFAQAKETSKKAENFLVTSKEILSFFGLNKFFDKSLSLGEHLSLGIKEGSQAAQNLENLSEFIFQGKEGSLEESISEIKVSLSQAYFYLSFVESELKNPTLNNQTKKFNYLNRVLSELGKKIPQAKELILEGQKTLEFFPWLVGKDDKRTYLVLFQNSAELRPTGGFIGSFAFLTFEKGKFVDFEVQDVYWADGQLKGHVEPPLELKKYLGEANWYLRDANWDPDFPTSARKIQWFLEKETGRKVDGVVSINLFVARRLLEAVGEIELPDYKEKINANNFFERAQYHSEIGFFPGSTQKQDFLGAVARILFEKIKNAQGKTKIEIGKSIYQSLKAKDILLYLNNSQMMETIFDLGWEGSVRNVKCQMSNLPAGQAGAKCFEDYLFIVEANVGVNKANYFVERTLSEEMKVENDGRIKKSLKISYQNKSPSSHFPAGDYKNYLRILVPQGSELEKVFVSSQELEKEKIDVSNVSQKTSFGFLVNVPVGEKKEVEIIWFLPEKIEFAEKVQYLYFVQKQSGVKPEKYSLKVVPPLGVAVIPVWPVAKVEGGNYLFSPDFSSDLPFEFYFVR